VLAMVLVLMGVSGSGEPIELSDGVWGAATHRPDQAASHQGRAVSGRERIAAHLFWIDH
jgi:hypothetical protein